MNDELTKKAHKLAVEAMNKAYAPYSKFSVGCCIKFKGQEELIPGCNVENISYPACVCAERNAIFSSVAKWSKVEIEWMVLVTDTQTGDTPCGVCLQVIREFTQDDAIIYSGNKKEILKTYSLNEIFPTKFSNPLLKQP